GEPPRRPICPARYHASLAALRAHSRRHVRRAPIAAWYPAICGEADVESPPRPSLRRQKNLERIYAHEKS
ncbi:MAG: hypothetical protein LUC06_06050, partial [Oscillospiraceae bacterium]|nr:hypothetical protein [Oscillospiraceae bacterium]